MRNTSLSKKKKKKLVILYLSGLPLGAVLDEVLCHIHMTPFRSPMQRSRSVLVLSYRVDAVLDDKLGYIHMTRSDPMQRSHLVLVLGCPVGALLDEGHIHVTPSDAAVSSRACSGLLRWRSTR
jgi:hypothetical protein